ncbi:root hair defective 3-like protein, partial [Tanacetum coccineum]
MVATERCEEIARGIFFLFCKRGSYLGWLEIEEAVQSRLVPGFGKKLSSLIYNCLSSYDEEAIYFEDNVRSAKRKQLEEKLKQVMFLVAVYKSVAIDNFKKALCHAIAEGQGFAVVALDCTNMFMKIFDGQLE